MASNLKMTQTSAATFASKLNQNNEQILKPDTSEKTNRSQSKNSDWQIKQKNNNKKIIKNSINKNQSMLT